MIINMYRANPMAKSVWQSLPAAQLLIPHGMPLKRHYGPTESVSCWSSIRQAYSGVDLVAGIGANQSRVG